MKVEEKTNQKQHFDFYPFADEPDYWLIEPFEKNSDGYLSGRAIVTNIGVFPYMLEDGTLIRELRLPEEVFSEESLKSLKMLPLTDGHPDVAVDSENISEFQIGVLGESIRADQFYVSAPITVHKKEAVEKIIDGKRALSCGYVCDLEMTSGNYLGMEYDAIQRNIRYNHVSLVDRGRAGDAAVLKLDSVKDSLICLMDKNKMKIDGGQTMLKKITLDGVEYEADSDFIKEFQKVKQEKANSDKALENAKAEHTKKVSTLEANLDTAQEKNKELEEQLAKASNIDENEVEARVQARMVLHDAARRTKVEIADKAEIDIKKEIVAALFPKSAEKLEKADEAYVEGRFQIALDHLDEQDEQDDITTDTLKGDTSAHSSEDDKKFNSDAAYQKMIEREQNAWKKGGDE